MAIGFSTVDALTAPSSQMETGLQMLVSLEGEQQEAQAAAAASSGETGALAIIKSYLNSPLLILTQIAMLGKMQGFDTMLG